LITITLGDENDTARLASLLVQHLPAGSVVLLKGPLGAGKTTLARHVARALGFTGRVTSPTYTLIHTYPTPGGTLLHADVYRLPDSAQLWEFGLEEALEDARLALIEWGTPEILVADVEIEIEITEDGTRRLRLAALEPELKDVVATIEQAMRRGRG